MQELTNRYYKTKSKLVEKYGEKGAILAIEAELSALRHCIIEEKTHHQEIAENEEKAFSKALGKKI